MHFGARAQALSPFCQRNARREQKIERERFCLVLHLCFAETQRMREVGRDRESEGHRAKKGKAPSVDMVANT